MIDELILPAAISLRRVSVQDDPFLWALFCAVRADLALLPLPAEQVELLMRQQYRFQQQGYANQFPLAESWVIEYQSIPAGKIMLDCSANAVHVIDIAVVPEYRSRGIGSGVLVAISGYVNKCAGVLSLSVDRQNIAARRLYDRLGFVICQQTATHDGMQWVPSPS
jgi:ribosomal protein S18 acetylase RimI-like enzyme